MKGSKVVSAALTLILSDRPEISPTGSMGLLMPNKHIQSTSYNKSNNKGNIKI